MVRLVLTVLGIAAVGALVGAGLFVAPGAVGMTLLTAAPLVVGGVLVHLAIRDSVGGPGLLQGFLLKSAKPATILSSPDVDAPSPDRTRRANLS